MKNNLLKISKPAIIMLGLTLLALLLAITMLSKNKLSLTNLENGSAIKTIATKKNATQVANKNSTPLVSEAMRQAWQKEQESWNKDIQFFNATKKAFEQKLQQLNLITREMNRYQGRTIPANLERDYDQSKTEALIAHEKLMAMAQKILSKQGDRS